MKLSQFIPQEAMSTMLQFPKTEQSTPSCLASRWTPPTTPEVLQPFSAGFCTFPLSLTLSLLPRALPATVSHGCFTLTFHLTPATLSSSCRTLKASREQMGLSGHVFLDDAAQCNSKTAEEMHLLSQRRQASHKYRALLFGFYFYFHFFETRVSCSPS